MIRSVAWISVVVAVAVGCGSDVKPHAVELAEVTLSPDRRVLTVSTYYPVDLVCAKQPAGVAVDVQDGIAVVSAFVSATEGDTCSLECATVVQSMTLDEPLPEGVKFAAPADALRGCGLALT